MQLNALIFIVDDLYGIMLSFPFDNRDTQTKWKIRNDWLIHIIFFSNTFLYMSVSNGETWCPLCDTVLFCQLLVQCTIHLGPPVIFIVMFEML